MDIIKILHEIAQNEHEKYKSFKKRLVEYCMNKKNAVFKLHRLLKGIEIVLSDCLSGREKVNVDRAIIIKVLKTIRIELDIVKCRMRHPDKFDQSYTMSLQPESKWTNDKVDLVELIYAIKKLINRGKVSDKAIQEACEYIFQIELGDIEEKFKEIEKRKENKALFLESLINNLSNIHDELIENTSHRKLKWTGSIVDFVELIYALHAGGYANDGKISLKELFKEMGDFFDFEVNEYSNYFMNIKNRSKGDRTKFLDELKTALLQKMEKSDENPSRK